MDITPLHSWSLTPSEAIALQKELARQVDTTQPLKRCDFVAGADVSCNLYSPIFFAAVVVLRTSDWTIVEKQEAVGESPFPYIPGLLSFREAPILLEAFAKVCQRPDAVMVDGQGFAHMRRFGIACHLGLWLNVPTIGCAKSRLVGKACEPGLKPGCKTSLRIGKEEIGKVVRTRQAVKPLYISAGHGIDLASAVRLVLRSCQGHRLPEPTRQAHLHVNEMRLARSASDGFRPTKPVACAPGW